MTWSCCNQATKSFDVGCNEPADTDFRMTQTGSFRLDAPGLRAFNGVTANDIAEFERKVGGSTPFPATSRVYRYRLLDSALTRMRFDQPILSMGIRKAGAIIACHGGNSLPTEVLHEGDESEFVGFTTILHGRMTLIDGRSSTFGTTSQGLAFRMRDQTRMVSGDQSARTHVSLKLSELETALEQALDARLRRPLEFQSEIDWSRGLAASFKWQLAFLMQEFERPDGVVNNAVALASMTDFLVGLALRAAPNNYSDQLSLGPATVVPAYVRRAEDFMRAHCNEPIRLTDVAAAAGCSVRTLGAVFPQFRGQTPLAALHAFRLEQVHAELSRSTADTPIKAVAHSYGFTNASRFTTAFLRRFGETPADVVRRASRPQIRALKS